MSRFTRIAEIGADGVLVERVKQEMGTLRHPPIADLALSLRDKYNLQTLIETGTCLGNSTTWAAENFKKVITIELNLEFLRQAFVTCKSHTNIDFLMGDSRERLKDVVPALARPALFWIDAHGLNVFPAENPIWGELCVILESPHKHFLLVDDANFYHVPFAEEGIPRAESLTLKDINSLISVYGYAMWEAHDVLVVAPISAADDIVKHLWVPYE